MYIYIYDLLVFYFCFISLDICNCCNPVLLQYIHLYSYFTPTLLLLFLLCMCVCRLTVLVESVEQSEGLSRDGACQNAVLQKIQAGQATLHEPPDVCLLINVGVAQARTRLTLGLISNVPNATQVRDGCCWRVI
jgi:hypothetical protein